MISFTNDYSEGAHPRILQALSQINLEQNIGYGMDPHCEKARAVIRDLCQAPEADVHFLVGGTQANATILDALLRPYQGVISAQTGHIAVHETGAIESTGHKVLALPGVDGKLTAPAVDAFCAAYFADETAEHMVQPAAVYVSSPSEFGTIYSRAELSALRAVCDRWGLVLFLDGARLGYGLASPKNDLDLPFLAKTCDVFYIGGTKQGLLMGEAVVFRDAALARGFRNMMKRHGAMLAKGFLLGVQFEEALRDGLYFDIAREAVRLAMRLREAFARLGIPVLMDSPTNQQFPILPDAAVAALRQEYIFSVIEKVDAERTAVRFCTSWATREENVEKLIASLERLTA